MSLTRREFGGIAAALTALNAQAAPSVIDMVLRDGVEKRKIPAAVAMVADSRQVRYSGAFGVRDQSGAPVRIDAIFSIASMTKAITTVAALQLVERGQLELDQPVGRYLTELAELNILEGFAADGTPRLRPARKSVTLRHLLTHTSGFCYTTWDANLAKYRRGLKGNVPRVDPLMFEPGERWEYGTGLDWTGRLVEKVSGQTLEDYFQTRILRPLGMLDTSFVLPAAKFDRFVTAWQRRKNGALDPDKRLMPKPPKGFNGGGGLYSTAGDYVRFMQMILNKGAGVDGARVISTAMVAEMEKNQIGDMTAGKLRTTAPETSEDVDMQPGFTEKWGLGFLINTTPYAGGRSAGSLAWAGILNTYFWIDPTKALCAVLMMPLLPFVDKAAVGLLGDFERAVYA